MSLDVVKSFCQRALLIEDERAGKCVRIALSHSKASGSASRLHSWTVTEYTNDAAAQIAADAYRIANDHAEAFDGQAQRFALGAYYGDSVEPARTGAFRITVSDSASRTANAAEPTEEPNSRGLVSQQMRHTEAMTRLMLQSTEVNFRTLVTQNQQLVAENDSLRTRLHESMTAVEKALSEQHRRDLEDKKFAMSAEMRKDIAQKVNLLLPVIVNRLAGAAVLPPGPAGDRMKALVASIEFPQLQQMAAALSPEQQIAFFSLIQDYIPEQPKTH